MEKEQNKYTKNAILRARAHFSGVERDILFALLKDDVEYTIAECRAILDKESKRKVK